MFTKRTLELPTQAKLLIPALMLNFTRRANVTNVMLDTSLRRSLGLVPGIAGGSQPTGFHTEADVITTTVDGVSTNELWSEFQAVLADLNRRRQPIVDLLTYTVPRPVETVPQVGSNANFEKASEYGVPVAVRTGVGYFRMGFAFDWFDTGARYTWKYLTEASAEQIRSVFETIVEGDNRMVFMEVMRSLYRNTTRFADINDIEYNVYPFYNGDSTVPPTVGATTFSAPHNHYVRTGAATVDQGDLNEALDDLESHGYTQASGYQLVFLVNKQELNTIRTFKSVQNGGTARFDFIPAQGTPNFLLPASFRVNTAGGGSQPANTYRGITVAGSYGDALILVNDYFPANYVVLFATGGPENIANPIGIREHARPELRGLRMVKTRQDDYPLQDAYWQRGFGTGIRHRGAAYVMQVATAGTYAPPTVYL